MDPIVASSVGTFGLVGAATAGKVWNDHRIQKIHRNKFRYIRILPHELVTSENVKIERLIDLFGGFNRTKWIRVKRGRDWFRFLIYKDANGKLAFYFGYPEDRTTGVRKAFENAYPDAELHPVSHEQIPLPNINKDGYGGYFVSAKRGEQEGLPYKAFQSNDDGLPDVLSCLSAGEKETEVWLDIVFTPTSNREIKRVVDRAQKAIQKGNVYGYGGMGGVEKFAGEVWDELNGKSAQRNKRAVSQKRTVTKELDNEKQAHLRSLRERFTGRESAFRTAVFLYVSGNYSSSVAQTAATAIRNHLDLDNGLHFRRAKNQDMEEIAPIPGGHKQILWTGKEIANLIHLPAGDHRIYEHIPHLKSGQRSLKDSELNSGVSVGTLNHPIIQNREVKIPRAQFTKHFVLTGMTGAGKSSEGTMICQSLINDWLDDPERAPGFSYFDPARETVATILTRLLKAEMDGKKVDWSRVHYIYLGPSEYSIGLNLLHKMGGEESDSIVGDVLGLMKYAYGGDTPQMDRIVRNTLMTLVEDKDPHAILGIVPLLTNEDFRNRIVPRVQDPVTKQFWKTEFKDLESRMGQAIGPILNRLSPFTNNRTMRRMFGQMEWRLDLKKYMDEGHILLWDLLNVGPESIKLTGGHLANQFYKTAKTRRSGAREHFMMIDEAHLVQVPVIPKIIAETRKFGLCLGLISQFVNQFESSIIEAISENVGTVLTCTQGPKSAAAVSAMTAGYFDKNFLQTLPERIVAVYTKDKGEDGRNKITTCLVEADPPYVYKSNGQIADHTNEKEMDEAIEWGLSKGRELLQRDGKHFSEIDKAIDAYMHTGTILQAAQVRPIENISLEKPTVYKNKNVPSLIRPNHTNEQQEVAEADEEIKTPTISWDDF